MVEDLNYEGIEFPASKKDFSKIEKKNIIYINLFCYENNMVYPVYVSNETFENCMDLLVKTCHIMVIRKILADLRAISQKIKMKLFSDIVCSVLVVKEFW